MDRISLTRSQLLAAEIYGHSYANYQDHLGIGNVRYDSMMPAAAETLDRAVEEGWSVNRLAGELDVDTDEAAAQLAAVLDALDVVDAENPAESFRNAVRQVVKKAVTDGLHDEEDIEQLVIQICYRASDLAYLLKQQGTRLSRYSRHLRRERDVEYFDGYFDEED